MFKGAKAPFLLPVGTREYWLAADTFSAIISRGFSMLNPADDPLRKDKAPTQGAMNYALTIPTIGSGSPSTALASVAGNGLTVNNPADSTERAVGGGVIGSLSEGNDVIARANTARAGMINSMIEANGGNGIGLLGVDQNGMTQTDRDNQEKTQRWRQDELMKAAMGAGGGKSGRDARAGISQALSQLIAGQNQLAVETMRSQNQMASDQSRNSVAMRGQDLNYATTVAQQGLTARGQDLNAARDDQRIGIERSRLSLAEADQTRAGEKFALDKRIAEGQIVDSESVRAARTELSAALASGDPAKVAIAREKAIAAGVKLEKPNNEFTAVTNQMGGTTILNKDTGAGAIYNIEGKKVVDIAAPRGATSPQQEYQAAIAAAAGDPKKIEAINARAKQMGVIQ